LVLSPSSLAKKLSWGRRLNEYQGARSDANYAALRLHRTALSLCVIKASSKGVIQWEKGIRLKFSV